MNLAPDALLTETRKARLRRVVAARQLDLTLVLHNIHDPHNVSAILRSCDAFGVGRVHLLYTRESFPNLSEASSASARKWVDTVRHRDAASLVAHLQGQGFSVVATGMSSDAVPVMEWNFTRPTAVILGNEHRGLDPDLAALVSHTVCVPMYGMVQSLNVSVAAAIILYEAMRQRRAAGLLERPALDPEAQEVLYADYCLRGKPYAEVLRGRK
ncbi:tRNA (guanosine(18)-2'-O)-methyltransferase [Thermodesulfomicrobium sp. WS]|uniref:TrmH family RNA methyltransferase n=1 Tax=Thermodesulfomicrobium sp. WS TaxID=3004129 RepID=UPI00248F4AAC|nr:RNA methyltransferase [Thermodesulfomicrobium sp. WS]BDV00809.1 tRNA (guanosine(18)-2'-O)-methyltransferase [Thermodesulfomicrobium sp. WS]